MTRHAGTHRAVLLAAIFMLALAVAGCSADAGSALDGAGGQAHEAAPSAPAGGEEPANGVADESGRPVGEFAPIEQRIVKTGEVGLEVDDVAAILAQVRAMAVEIGGYVGGSQAGTLDESASVTLRVPAERFDELITRLQELSGVEVVSMATREQDVTGQVVDLDARIRNLRASEASYRVLFDRAQRIEDILTVQGRLDEVRGQIEQLDAQLQSIEGQAAMSTLTVTIIPRGEPVAAVQEGWDPGAQASRAVATLIGLAQGLFDALVWLVIVILPLALVVGLVALVAIRMLPEVRRRVSPADAAASGEEPAS